jgi:cell division inhibitor SepF
MSSLFSKALVYLGLVDEDQAPGDVEHDPVDRPVNQQVSDDQRNVRPLTPPEGRRVEPPPATSRTAPAMVSASSGTGMRASSGLRTIRPDAQTNILVVEEFGDAKILADWVRDRIPVVMDLRRTDSDLIRRVVDFSSGLIYALDGRMRKVGDALVLITPAGMDLAYEEKRRLQALGAWEISPDE